MFLSYIKSKIIFFKEKIKWRKKNRNNSTSIVNCFDQDSVSVGNFTYGPLNVIKSQKEGKLSIGHFCSIADGVKFILGSEHPTNCLSTFPFKVKMLGKEYEAQSKGDIIIGDDVWIATNAIILSGVSVGQGAVIGAGAVVTKDVPSYAIVGGVPAKVIKYRFDKEVIEKLLRIDFSKIGKDFVSKNSDLIYSEIMKGYDFSQYPQKPRLKVLVTGASGQLGFDVVNELKKRNHEAVGVDIGDMDITDGGSVKRVMQQVKPDAVIHCAAWTAVDAAEEQSNREKVYDINVNGTKHIVEQCKLLDCKMIYISTDYVFDGTGTAAWDADCKDYKPLGWYGQTKLDGEIAVSGTLKKYYIVRTAWAFGSNGNNFVDTMLKIGQTRSEVKVVCDQIGTPTYTYDLAQLLVDMVEADKYGYYHATNEGGYISWADFAEEIFRQSGLSVKVNRVTTEEYGSKALRPKNSRLDKSKLTLNGFNRLPEWNDSLKIYLNNKKN